MYLMRWAKVFEMFVVNLIRRTKLFDWFVVYLNRSAKAFELFVRVYLVCRSVSESERLRVVCRVPDSVSESLPIV